MVTIRTQKRFKNGLKRCVPPILMDAYKKRQDYAIMKTAGATPQEARFILPSKSLEEIFPHIEEAQISIQPIQLHPQDAYALPLREVLTIALICQHLMPKKIFEIGTFTGSTTLTMATNSDAETEVFTLDLDEQDERVGSYFRDKEIPNKITQLFGNSLVFDFEPFQSSMDVVFVDGDHSYKGVAADTKTAFHLLRPGGVIIWDDYRWEKYVGCAGVTKCLNELGKTKRVSQVSGTRLAVYQDVGE